MEDTRLVSDVQCLTESVGQLPESGAELFSIAVSGLPGTGKSYFYRKLAERLPFVILESGVLREILFHASTYAVKGVTC